MHATYEHTKHTQEKVKKADLVIQNDGTLEELLQNAHHALQRTAELVGATKELK